jgi:hypothetical protein
MFKYVVVALVLDLKSRTQSLIWYRSTLVSFIDLVNKLNEMLLKWIKVVFLVNSKMAGTTKHDPVGNT